MSVIFLGWPFSRFNVDLFEENRVQCSFGYFQKIRRRRVVPFNRPRQRSILALPQYIHTHIKRRKRKCLSRQAVPKASYHYKTCVPIVTSIITPATNTLAVITGFLMSKSVIPVQRQTSFSPSPQIKPSPEQTPSPPPFPFYYFLNQKK